MSNVTRPRNQRRAFLTGTLLLMSGAAIALPQFDDWSSLTRIDSMAGASPALSTPAVDGCASIAPDGLSIYFTSNRTGNFDIYKATRASKGEGFGAPVRLPSPVNTMANEACPTITRGKTLYYSSDAEDPSYDLYVTRLGPKGYVTPQRLGNNINSNLLDETPSFYEDAQGRQVMIFSRRPVFGVNPPGVIFQSVDGAAATPVAGGPNAAGSNNRPSVTHDGLTMYFDSVRPGTLGGPDIYVSTRASTSAPWGDAVHLPHLSSPAFDARPYVSWDGQFLTIGSGRAGSTSPAPDIWFATRDRAIGR